MVQPEASDFDFKKWLCSSSKFEYKHFTNKFKILILNFIVFEKNVYDRNV